MCRAIFVRNFIRHAQGFVLTVSGVMLWAVAQISVAYAGDSEQRFLSRLSEAEISFNAIQGYDALFVKKEKEDGKMGESEQIVFRYEKPFKVFMKWINTDKKGLQVVYARGFHDNKLAIHKPGLLLGLAPIVFLAQDSPWIRKGSASYQIEDVGIGTFLNDIAKAARLSASQDSLRVIWHSEDKAEVLFLNSKDDEVYFAYRVELEFDASTELPVSMKLYDWDNQLTGEYAYQNIALNPKPSTIQPQMHRQIFKIYSQAKT